VVLVFGLVLSDAVEVTNDRPRWTFLTNYGHVLLCIAKDPEARLRDIAATVGITERAAQAIVGDLVEDGYLAKSRTGRRNTYEVHADAPMRHPASAGHNVGELLSVLSREGSVPAAQES
jgi:predicted transcriptional regulator